MGGWLVGEFLNVGQRGTGLHAQYGFERDRGTGQPRCAQDHRGQREGGGGNLDGNASADQHGRAPRQQHTRSDPGEKYQEGLAHGVGNKDPTGGTQRGADDHPAQPLQRPYGEERAEDEGGDDVEEVDHQVQAHLLAGVGGAGIPPILALEDGEAVGVYIRACGEHSGRRGTGERRDVRGGFEARGLVVEVQVIWQRRCLLYTSDAADE